MSAARLDLARGVTPRAASTSGYGRRPSAPLDGRTRSTSVRARGTACPGRPGRDASSHDDGAVPEDADDEVLACHGVVRQVTRGDEREEPLTTVDAAIRPDNGPVVRHEPADRRNVIGNHGLVPGADHVDKLCVLLRRHCPTIPLCGPRCPCATETSRPRSGVAVLRPNSTGRVGAMPGSPSLTCSCGRRLTRAEPWRRERRDAVPPTR